MKLQDVHARGLVGGEISRRGIGDLTVLNVVSSQGAGLAPLNVDPLGQSVFVANCGGGSFAVLPIQMDGSLANASFVQQDIGSVAPTQATGAPPGILPLADMTPRMRTSSRPTRPANSFSEQTWGRTGSIVGVLDRTAGRLIANTPAFVSVPPGDGPRHFAFHTNGLYFYSLQEEASTLLRYTYDAATGSLSQQQISTVPPGFAGTDFSSEVRVAPGGGFVFAANRLHDTISAFGVGFSGQLTRVGEASTLGDDPRSFTIAPTGNFLICCNQRSDVLTTFRFQPLLALYGLNALAFTGQYTPVGSPAAVVFLT